MELVCTFTKLGEDSGSRGLSRGYSLLVLAGSTVTTVMASSLSTGNTDIVWCG